MSMEGWSPRTLVRYGFCVEDDDGKIVSVWNFGELGELLRDFEDIEDVDSSALPEDFYADMPHLESPEEILELEGDLPALERSPFVEDQALGDWRQTSEHQGFVEDRGPDRRLCFEFTSNIFFLYVLCRNHNVPTAICYELLQELVEVSVKNRMIFADCGDGGNYLSVDQ